VRPTLSNAGVIRTKLLERAYLGLARAPDRWDLAAAIRKKPSHPAQLAMEFKWIVKGLVESIFVVGSILMALAVDQWSQDRDFAELADQSLGIFEREILQNQARVEDVAPYHQGIRDILAQMRQLPDRGMDLRNIMEGLTPPVLLNTAWETSLATGALTHMDFEVVSALSLTYSIQDSRAAADSNAPGFQLQTL